MNMALFEQEKKSVPIKASDSASWLLSHGISSISTVGLAELLGIPKNQIPSRMAALKRRHAIISPAHGLWIPVPPEYMTWGAPPAIDMIDALMRHMGVDYYIGWLSAAQLHGASHHAPQVFQVATSRMVRNRVSGRTRFQFYHRARIGHIHLAKVEARSCMVPVSSKETTLLDVANDIEIAGGIDNAANIIIELCEEAEPDIAKIIDLSAHYPVTALRRLGYLLDEYSDISGLDTLRDACSKHNEAPSILDPQAEKNGAINRDWNIRINREVSLDI